MISFLKHLLINSVGVILGAYLIPGVHVTNGYYAILVALVWGILHRVVRPILIIITLPLTVITLGLFLFVINVVIIELTAYLIDGFKIASWGTAFLFSLLFSIYQLIIRSLVDA